MIDEIRRILQSGVCLSDFSDKCKNDGACKKCENEALEKLIAEHDRQIRKETIAEISREMQMLYGNEYEQKIREEVIEIITDKIIYPLLDECDRGLWEHISYIDLAKEWIKVLDDNPYPKVKNYTEARKRDLRQWIAEKLKENK